MTKLESKSESRPITEEADFLQIKSIDHLHFYVGNAKHAMYHWWKGFGFQPVAYSGLETGNRESASYVMQSGQIRLVFSAPYGPSSPVAAHHMLHGDGVKVIALEVDDVEKAWKETTARGGRSAWAPREEKDDYGIYRTSAIQTYGETLHVFVDRDDYKGVFAPGYRPIKDKDAEFNRAGGRGPYGRQCAAGQDERVGELLSPGDGVPPIAALRRQGYLHRILRA